MTQQQIHVLRAFERQKKKKRESTIRKKKKTSQKKKKERDMKCVALENKKKKGLATRPHHTVATNANTLYKVSVSLREYNYGTAHAHATFNHSPSFWRVMRLQGSNCQKEKKTNLGS